MEQLSLREEIRVFVIELKEYAETKYDLARLGLIEKTAIVATAILMTLILSVLVFTIIVFLSFALAFFLGEIYHNVAYGFLLVGLGYVVLTGFIYVSRSFFIRRPILKALIRLILPNDDDEEGDTHQSVQSKSNDTTQ